MNSSSNTGRRLPDAARPRSASPVEGSVAGGTATRAGRWAAIVAGAALVASSMVVPAAAQAAVPAPILTYGFDGLGAAGASVVSGTTVADSAGSRAGTVQGAGATAVVGPAGGDDRALLLPGGAANSTAGHVVIPPGLLTAPGDVTISAWVKWTGGQTCAWPFTLGRSTNDYLFFTPSCGGRLIGAAKAGSETRATGSGPLGTGWTHVAVSLSSGRSVSTFINGQQVASTPTGVTGAAAQGTSAFSGYLGKSFYGADPYFAGALDDVRVYTSALTAAQVTEIGAATYQAIARTDAATGVSLGDTSAVTTSIALPATGAGGSSITWASSDPAVIAPSGAVTRPAAGRPDARVTLTPTFAFAGESVAGAGIEVTVPAVTQDELASLFADQYVIEPVVAAGTVLADLGAVDAVYTSSDPAVTVSSSGEIRSTSAAAVDTRITAAITASGERLSKTFEVRVLPAAQSRSVLGYQRTPLAPQVYDTDLAASLHLALGDADGSFTALHDNTGVLFAEGLQTADHLHSTTTFRSPWLFHRADGEGYGVLGVLADAAGVPLASHAGRLVYFETDDLRQYRQVGYVRVDSAAVSSPRAVWDSASDRYVLSWSTASGAVRTAHVSSLAAAASGSASVSAPAAGVPVDARVPAATGIDGAIPGNAITIDAATARALEIRFGRIVNTTRELDTELETTAGEPVDLDSVRARLGYSDGSTVEYPIEWNAAQKDAVDFDTPGTYTVSGQLRDQRNVFPLARQRADPTIIRWNDSYVMVSTWDVNNVGSAGLPLRVSDTLAGLATAPEVRIITNTQNATDDSRLMGCFWAPDILEVNGQLQIFVAPCYGTASWSSVVSTVIKLRPGGDPADPADWSQPQKVTKADGTPLRLDANHPGISLDMTYFRDPETGTEYAVWSERYINSPHAGGTGTGNGDAELWIAEYDPDAARLITDPVVLNRATASWEQNNTDVVEGAFFTVKDGSIWMTYSGSNVDATYATGIMRADVGADLLDPAVWTEYNAPVVKSDPARGEYGPGHSGFFADEFGDLFFVYHAMTAPGATRDAGIRKVFWASDGQPILDMTDDERIAPQNRDVSVTITVAEDPNALDVTATTAWRCVAGKAVVVVTTTNDDTRPVALALRTGFGSAKVAALAPGASRSIAFSTRSVSVPAGSVEVTASIGGGTTEVVTAAYPARSCG